MKPTASTTRVLGADGHFFRRQVEGFARGRARRSDPGSDIVDGVQSVKVMAAIRQSVARASRWMSPARGVV
jgi:hypothetical protein